MLNISIRILTADENDSSVLVYTFAEVLILHSGKLYMPFLHIVPFASRKYTIINFGFL